MDTYSAADRLQTAKHHMGDTCTFLPPVRLASHGHISVRLYDVFAMYISVSCFVTTGACISLR